jgi:hypothetical protein
MRPKRRRPSSKRKSEPSCFTVLKGGRTA